MISLFNERSTQVCGCGDRNSREHLRLSYDLSTMIPNSWWGKHNLHFIILFFLLSCIKFGSQHSENISTLNFIFFSKIAEWMWLSDGHEISNNVHIYTAGNCWSQTGKRSTSNESWYKSLVGLHAHLNVIAMTLLSMKNIHLIQCSLVYATF